MIGIISGAPGCGKTLWTMQEVTKLAQSSKRPVYYSHIPDVTLPWHPVGDAAVWSDANKIPQPLENRDQYHELPQGSIIIIDEAWAQFPNRQAGSAKPSFIEAFATHRHRGHDFYLLSQNPGQLDQFIRGMVNLHVHLERQFGLPKASVWSWESKIGKPGDYFSKEEATKSQFIYPKKFYSAYKSSDLHVVQQRLPIMRLAGIAALCVVAVLLIGFVLTRFGGHKEAEAAKLAAVAAKERQSEPIAQPAQAYAAKFKERIVGWQYSASFYDERVKPATFPKISGCMLITGKEMNRCTCTTQQGTTLADVDYMQCVYYVKNGWFDFSKPDDDSNNARGSQALATAFTQSSSAPLSPGGVAAGATALNPFR